jgi:hypothetical protein
MAIDYRKQHIVITSERGLLDLKLKELGQYKDLIFILAKKRLRSQIQADYPGTCMGIYQSFSHQSCPHVYIRNDSKYRYREYPENHFLLVF